MAEDKYAPEDDRPHVDTDVCGLCRKKVTKGHRVSVAHIIDRKGLNPLNLGQPGIFLKEEYEFVHINCHDPYLKKGLQGA